MPVSRYPTQTQSLLGGTRYGSENQTNMMGKAAAGKPRLTTAGARAALSNISNKAPTNTNIDAKKGAVKEINKPITRAFAKSQATSSLHSIVNKENASAKEVQPMEIKETLPKSPAPMEISASEAFSHKQILPVVTDIDKDDKDNPQLVSEYVNEIYDYMRDLERKFNVKIKYLDGSDINGRMRGILVDWLVQVHLRFHLLQETLYLTVAIIDRFLQEHKVARSKLQLVGVSAMLVASKYEEMYAPEIGDFVYITDNAYSKADIRKMECLILKTLDFNLGKPLPLHFLRRNSKAGEVDASKHTLAKYLMELTIVDYDLVHTHPSEIAAAALCLSMKVLDGKTNWSDTLSFYSKYNEKELMLIMQKMAVLVQKSGTGKLTAIHTKYKSSKFMRISTIPELKCAAISELAEGNL